MLIAIVFLVVIIMLFLPLRAAEAGERSHAALVLICPRDNLAECTVTTARIYFVVPVETSIPSGCLALGQQKMAEVSELMDAKTEAVKISCGR